MISRPTWPAWTLCGILLALLLGTFHAFVLYLLDLKTVGKLWRCPECALIGRGSCA